MKENYVNAQSFCNSVGLELATFESKNESDWFSNLLNASCQNFDPGWCHVGGMRFFNDASVIRTEIMKNWYWQKSGKKINFDLNWHPLQPDNYNFNQWCLAVSKINGKMFYADIQCYNRDEYFICQKFSLLE